MQVYEIIYERSPDTFDRGTIRASDLPAALQAWRLSHKNVKPADIVCVQEVDPRGV